MAQISTDVRRLELLVACSVLAGCAATGAVRSESAEAPLRAGSSMAPSVVEAAPAVVAVGAPAATLGATRCVDELLARDVAFVPLRRSRGVAVPVQIEGPVAGVRYQPTAGFSLVVDCRFALVLAGVGPILRRHGVSTVEFSIAHAYRPTRAGHLSLHANGLALDVHGAVFDDGGERSVAQDFARRLGALGCAADSKPMNQLACELKHTGWFSEFLTPDDNRDHADHFHLGISRLASAPGAGAAIPPRP